MKSKITISFFIILGLATTAVAKGQVLASVEEKPITGSVPAQNLTVKDYPTAAKINSRLAAKMATDAVPGQIISIGLESEDGFLVYAVEVVANNSILHEINVDAGDGKILSKKIETKSSERSNDDDEEDKD